MHKFRWIILNIICLSIPYFYAKHKAKKILTSTNNQLKTSDKVEIDIDELLSTLGGKENIVNVSATISTLKVNVKNGLTLNKEQFSKFKINGFMKNKNQIILVFGDNAQAINEQLTRKI
ncbi:MAG: PTS transporter subunit EIIB [Mycoplasmataceae bacterium]|jgi:PTS system glucose-specific IIC component|nr:PTS transporter subunit EIIB [Mycoplasmataceae bacterium]